MVSWTGFGAVPSVSGCVFSDLAIRVGINLPLFCPLFTRIIPLTVLSLLTLTSESLLHRKLLSMVGRFLSTKDILLLGRLIYLHGFFLTVHRWFFNFLVFVEFGPFSQFHGWFNFFWSLFYFVVFSAVYIRMCYTHNMSILYLTYFRFLGLERISALRAFVSTREVLS